jgi:hypothetical protein
MLLEVIGRTKRRGLTQINMGKELPEKSTLDSRGVKGGLVYFDYISIAILLRVWAI